jgi:SAM-dependent methyltransferase
MLYLVMRDKMNFFSSRIKLLHFAPEKCLYNKIKQHPNIEYVTADYMTSFMENIGVIPDYVMSVDDIKFEDESFDVVICIGILLLVPDDHKAIKEIYRVLRKGGYAIFQDPIQTHSPVTLEDPNLSPQERLRQYGGENHVRYYGRDYKERLEQHGFKVTVEDYIKKLDTARYRLAPTEYVYIAHK